MLRLPTGPSIPPRILDGILKMCEFNRKYATENIALAKQFIHENDEDFPCQNLIFVGEYFAHCLRLTYCGDVCLAVKMGL